MKPYTPANYSFEDAAHLLRRMGFGGPPAQVEALRRMGPALAVETLARAGPFGAGSPATSPKLFAPCASSTGRHASTGCPEK